MADKPIIGILLGDAAGIGPELVAKLATSGFLSERCRPLIIGDRRVFDLGLKIAASPLRFRTLGAVEEFDSAPGIQLLDQANLDPERDFRIGELSEKCGAASLAMLETAIGLYKEGRIEGFCFAPLNKAAMKSAGMRVESEHHFMAELFDHHGPFGEINVVGKLWTTRTTSHIPIKDVSANLSLESIGRAIRLAHGALRSSGIEAPRLALAALNPHAGENGHCGREEIDVIGPAIARARAEGIDAAGPFPSDILFIKAFAGEFDGVVTMYHDQGQIALKLKGFDEGITIAGGFPAPIVTCGHGTAYDIAGKGLASTGALENAVSMACRMAAHASKGVQR